MPEDGARLRAVAVAARDPERARRVRESSESHPLVPDARHGPVGVMATGRSECLAAAPGPRARGLEELGGQPASVPLQARGRTGRADAAVRARRAGFSSEDVSLAGGAGSPRRVLAIDNAQLYCKSQESIRVRDLFLSIASHEPKTPLTSK